MHFITVHYLDQGLALLEEIPEPILQTFVAFCYVAVNYVALGVRSCGSLGTEACDRGRT
jgi:hypothetical protein